MAYVPSSSVFKDDIFRGKVLFCTGGGTGICQKMVEAVMLQNVLHATATELSKNTLQRCSYASGDVRSVESLAKAVAKCISEYGRIDFVIAGAAGNFLYPSSSTRVISQSWVDALSQALAVEFGPHGIRSNVIAPGLINDTEGSLVEHTRISENYHAKHPFATVWVLESVMGRIPHPNCKLNGIYGPAEGVDSKSQKSIASCDDLDSASPTMRRSSCNLYPQNISILFKPVIRNFVARLAVL
ncbi:hypothetical protein H4Q26_013649 [Puccinia striiformis f. sp. tritici PST-130]|nr:hypothetical protein H4Q26_013649 [Puccinia striiformis f. sp. tritici PST-130]